MVGGFAAAQSGARWARGAAGGALYRGLLRVQDALPSRGVRNRRVTPLSARREMQRRAAMALLSLVVVVGGLGAAVFVLGGSEPTGPAIADARHGPGRRSSEARDNLGRVIGPGIDLVVNDRRLAEELLTEAYTALDGRAAGGRPGSDRSTRSGPRSSAALDRLYGMVDVASTPLFTFPDEPAVDLQAIVQGPDGAPFVLDAATKTVYRIDLADDEGDASIFREGNKAAGATQGGAEAARRSAGATC